MERVKNYINHFIIPELYSKGILYLSEDYLFVDDKIEILSKKEDLTSNLKKRKVSNAELLFLILNNKDIPEKRLIELRILDGYQSYLTENELNKRKIKNIRVLISDIITKHHPNFSLQRDSFLINNKKIDLVFIDSISILISKIKDYKKNYLNSYFYYRGHSNSNWDLIPSVYRNSWIEKEHKMFREILSRNPIEFKNTKTAFEKLTIMQHYGLPTRLLDITRNPLVALYFACTNDKNINKPGEVFIFEPTKDSIKYYDSDTVSILSNIAKADRDLEIIDNKDEFNKDKGLKFLHLIKEEKPYFLDIIEPKDFNQILLVKPINNNERIKRQQGLFFLYGINKSINNPAKNNYIFKDKNKEIKFIIEATKKKEIIDELDAIGISRDTLFPEIENGAEYIKSDMQY
ncbi:MAG: FRG domain-containing protein [Bacteroidota bacterium]